MIGILIIRYNIKQLIRRKSDINMVKVEVDTTNVKLVCNECDSIEELPLKIILSGAVINCSECGNTIVETEKVVY